MTECWESRMKPVEIRHIVWIYKKGNTIKLWWSFDVLHSFYKKIKYFFFWFFSLFSPQISLLGSIVCCWILDLPYHGLRFHGEKRNVMSVFRGSCDWVRVKITGGKLKTFFYFFYWCFSSLFCNRYVYFSLLWSIFIFASIIFLNFNNILVFFISGSCCRVCSILPRCFCYRILNGPSILNKNKLKMCGTKI